MATTKAEPALRRRIGVRSGIAQEMTMTMPLAYRRSVLAALAVLVMVAVAMPALAQQRNSDGSPNPTASVVDQRTLLREFPRIEGRIDIPDQRAAVLIQPAGRIFQRFHEVILPWFGVIVLVGMLALLAIAYLVLGPIRPFGNQDTAVHQLRAFRALAECHCLRNPSLDGAQHHVR
jgi:formate dehydrogenase subunit gamma